MIAIIFGIEAIELGSVSLSMLFSQCGFLIPTIFNAIFFKESINALSIAGIALIVVALFMTIDKSDKKFSVKWLVFAVLSLVCSGVIGIVQKFNGVYYPNADTSLFIEISLVFAILAGLLTMLFLYLKEKRSLSSVSENVAAPVAPESKKQRIIRCVCVVLIGALLGIINVFNTFLAGKLPSVVYFPVYNVGVIILVTVASAILFKERLNVKQIISIAIGSLAIILIAVGRIV